MSLKFGRYDGITPTLPLLGTPSRRSFACGMYMLSAVWGILNIESSMKYVFYIYERVLVIHYCVLFTHARTHARTRARAHTHTRARAHTHTHTHLPFQVRLKLVVRIYNQITTNRL